MIRRVRKSYPRITQITQIEFFLFAQSADKTDGMLYFKSLPGLDGCAPCTA